MRSSRLEESARECGRTHQSKRCARRAGRDIGLGMCCASPERTSNVDVGVAEMKIMRSLWLEESARECRLNRVNVAPGFFWVRRRRAATVFEAGALCDYHHE